MADEVQTPTDVDPEPEGVIEIETPSEGGAKVKQQVVPASAIKAERARIRNVESQKRAELQQKLEAEQQKNAQLAQDLQAVRPHIEHLQKNPHLLKAGESPEIQAISDQEAEVFAREYELFTASGLDVARAKRMIAKNNARVEQLATQAAQKVIQPLQQSTAHNQSMAFLAWAKNQRGADGALLADPDILAQVWSEVPPELTADPRVAQERLRVAIGETLLQGKKPQAPAQREPLMTEAPGGFRERVYEMSPMERTIAQNTGVSESEWTGTAKKYVPGRTNRLGE